MWWIFCPGKEITAEECVQAEVTVELRKHRGRMLHELLHVPLQQLVQSVHTDVMARAAPQSAPVIGAAGVRGGKVAAAHGKHRAAAVAALEKAGIHIVVYPDAAIMALCALFPQSHGGGKGAGIDDGRVVVFHHDMVAVGAPYILAVDFGAGVFALPQRTDIEIVVQDPLYGDDRTCRLDLTIVCLPLCFLTQLLRHMRCGNALVCQVVRDFPVPPPRMVVEMEDLPHDLRLGRHDLKFPAPVLIV